MFSCDGLEEEKGKLPRSCRTCWPPNAADSIQDSFVTRPHGLGLKLRMNLGTDESSVWPQVASNKGENGVHAVPHRHQNRWRDCRLSVGVVELVWMPEAWRRATGSTTMGEGHISKFTATCMTLLASSGVDLGRADGAAWRCPRVMRGNVLVSAW